MFFFYVQEMYEKQSETCGGEKKELFLCGPEQDSLSFRFLRLIFSVVSVCFARSTELACLLDFAPFLSGEVKTEL